MTTKNGLHIGRSQRFLVLSSKDLKELETWLTPTEAAQIVGISRQGMVKRLEEGRQRGVKTHQGWLVDPTDVRRRDRRGQRTHAGVTPTSARVVVDVPVAGESLHSERSVPDRVEDPMRLPIVEKLPPLDSVADS